LKHSKDSYVRAPKMVWFEPGNFCFKVYWEY
jgi:hypothetical protein